MVPIRRHLLCAFICAIMGLVAGIARADSRGDELAQWIDRRGEELWGPPPPKCDDLTLARRVYFDLLGRSPSLAEIYDFESLSPETRRERLIEQLIFSEGDRKSQYQRQAALP
jgi:hypothetical protein